MSNTIISQAENFTASLNGTEVLETKGARSSALQYLQQNGLPVKKNEEYKFTFFSDAVDKKFSEAQIGKEVEISKTEVQELFDLPENSQSIVFVNGRLRLDLSDLSKVEETVSFSDFASYQEKHPGKVEGQLGKYADVQKDAFTAWNTVYANNGLVVDVPNKTVLDTPIFLLHVTDTRDGAASIGFPRTLINVGTSCQVELLSFYRTIGEGNSLVNEVNEIVLGENTKVTFNKVQDDVNHAYAIGETKVYQPSNSVFTSNTITVSGAVLRNNLNIDVDGQGSEANMNGLYLTKGTTHVDNHTTVDHIQPNSNSNELYKGIMDEKSRGVFNGKIYVRSEAQKTNAFQSNNNILLSDQAIVNTKPQLEIWADDVKCSHGCTTGQMDEEAVFYLRARGIGEADARALILKAFASDVIEKVENEWLSEYLDKIIVDRLAISQ